MLKIKEKEKVYKIWLAINTLAAFSLFVYFSLYQLAPNYFGRLYFVGYKLAPLLLVPSFLLFRGFRDGLEIKLYFFYCLLLSAIKILNGSVKDEIELIFLLGSWMCLCYISVASLHEKELSLRFLDISLSVICAGYCLVGIAGIYTAISGKLLLHPLTGATMCELVGGRLYLFSKNSNSVGGWYFMFAILQIYLFLRSRKIWQRLLIVFGILVSYICLALSFSRSSMISFSIAIGMIGAAKGLEYIPVEKLWRRVLALVLIVLILFSLCYSSFQMVSTGLAYLKTKQLEGEQKQGVIENTEELNSRGLESSGRTTIWIASFEALKEEPLRLLTGSPDAIEKTNEKLRENHSEVHKRIGDKSSHHSAYLDLFFESGIFGFALIMAFMISIIVKIIKVYFAQSIPMSVKTFAALLTGIFLYNLVESTLLFIYDMRTMIFCIVAGYILAFEKQLSKN